jgi:hypothetical protein
MGDVFSGIAVGARQYGSSAMACFCPAWAESTTHPIMRLGIDRTPGKQGTEAFFFEKRTKKLLLIKALRCFSACAN